MSSDRPPFDGPSPGESGDSPWQWSSYEPVDEILSRDSNYNPVFYDSSSDEDNIGDTNAEPEPLPYRDLDSSISGSEHGPTTQQEEVRYEASLGGDAVVAQTAEASGGGFFGGWFRKRQDAPAPAQEVPISQQSVPSGSSPIQKSEDRGLSDGLEGLGEETDELEKKKKGTLAMKAAALDVIGGAGAYAVVRKLNQDTSPHDDTGAASNSYPTSTVNNPDTSAVANLPAASAAVNPPDMAAAVAQNDGGAGVAQHVSAGHSDGGAVILQQASHSDGGATILQQVSHSDGGAIIIRGKQAANVQAVPNAAPAPNTQPPPQVQQMAIQAAQGAAAAVAVCATQFGGASAGAGAASAVMAAGLVVGVAVAVAAAFAAAGTVPTTVQTAQEIVSIVPSTSLFPSFAPSLFCERANEEKAFTSVTSYDRIQMFTAEERPIMEGAFVNVYNNLSLGCDDAYSRVMTDANMTEQSLFNAGVNATVALDTSWFSTVLCDQCPPTSPLFDDDNQFGSNNSQRMLRNGVFFSDFTLRFRIEIQRLVSVGMISSNRRIGAPSESPTVNPSIHPSQSSISPSAPVLSQSPTSTRSETPPMPANSTRTPSMSSVPSSSPSDPQLDPTSGPSGEPSTKPTALSSDSPSFASSVQSLSLSSFPSEAPVSSAPVLAPIIAPPVQEAPPSQAPVSSAPVLAPIPAPSVQGDPSLGPVEVPGPSEPIGKATSDQIETMEPSFSPSMPRSLDIGSKPTPTPVEQAIEGEQRSDQPSDDISVGDSQIPSVTPSGDLSAVSTRSPSSQPFGAPSSSPSDSPTFIPSAEPSTLPSPEPSSNPSNEPSVERSAIPSPSPSGRPTVVASNAPSVAPSGVPSSGPSVAVSSMPTMLPSGSPSASPTSNPRLQPSQGTSSGPSFSPTNTSSVESSNFLPSDVPTVASSVVPTALPSVVPSSSPSNNPSVERSSIPSPAPSSPPTIVESTNPSTTPSATPSSAPSNKASIEASTVPLLLPSDLSTVAASEVPTILPSVNPSSNPSNKPSFERSAIPSPAPSERPTIVASMNPSTPPSAGPFSTPSDKPSIETSNILSALPLSGPTVVASVVPSSTLPSSEPSASPSNDPSVERSAIPSPAPSNRPTIVESMEPSTAPSTAPSSTPSYKPSVARSEFQSSAPSGHPSIIASDAPSGTSSTPPSTLPSDLPIVSASALPTILPSASPSSSPSNKPSIERSAIPSPAPSTRPSVVGSAQPSNVPSAGPSVAPSIKPSVESSNMLSKATVAASAVPITLPSLSPSLSPSNRPSVERSAIPSFSHSGRPNIGSSSPLSKVPSAGPSSAPSIKPSVESSNIPSKFPSGIPTVAASVVPTTLSSANPSSSPSNYPSAERSSVPSPAPSSRPSVVASIQPSKLPSPGPSSTPSSKPSVESSKVPSSKPSEVPTVAAYVVPTASPSSSPSNRPSIERSAIPSPAPPDLPSIVASTKPSLSPSADPSASPSIKPSVASNTLLSTLPSDLSSVATSTEPFDLPTASPSSSPSNNPSVERSAIPSPAPSDRPTPTASSTPSTSSSSMPSIKPSVASSTLPPTLPSGLPTSNSVSGNGSISGNVTGDGADSVVNVTVMLQDAMGRNISTTFTNSNGEYEFLNLSPADYFILFQVDPFAPVRRIKVTLKAGEVANRNIFIESAVGSISGSVTEDLNNDNFGDVPLEGVLITLKNDRNVTIRTTLTNEVGLYLFSDVVDGNYVVVEANLNETFVDVKDKDGGALGKRNLINVKIENGKGSIGNDFVDERYGSISGSVKDDDGEAIQSVLLELKDAFTSTVMSTTVTGANGSYNFDKLLPGDYIVQEESLEDYPIDVLDQNTAGNGDASDTDTTIDNKIHVTVTSNEDDVGNDFVDSNKGSISGNVTSTDGNPISNVVITLTDSNGTNITTITGTTGDYVFEKIAPGNYSLTETNPTGYSGCSNVADTRIEIVLGPGSKCHGNNFVKTLKSKFPTSAPSENPPVLAPSLPPIEARLAPSEYCKELDNPSCSLCAAFHSPDYCSPHESFASLIQNRTHQFRSNPAAVVNEGYWFHYLEDKIAGYVLSIDQLAPTPKIFCCVTSKDQLLECLKEKVIPENPNGIVIKATTMHSNQGVFVLVNDTKSSAVDPIDLLTGIRTSYNDAVTALAYFQASKIIVEEFVGTSLPTEYKFHVINGEVAAIDVIDGRGTECPCYAVVDTNWTRLDQFGCFEPGGFEHVDLDTGCTAVDWKTGKRKAGPIKKDLNLCTEVPKLGDCLVEEMSAIALRLGNRIGVAMRIDMFVEDNAIYVQEYSPNHMNGIRHCSAKMENGCIDSCFLGRMWDAAGGDYGGDLTTVPSELMDYHTLTAQQQCDVLQNVPPPTYTSSSCSVA